jgi:hypothetical protein
MVPIVITAKNPKQIVRETVIFRSKIKLSQVVEAGLTFLGAKNTLIQIKTHMVAYKYVYFNSALS